MRLLALETTSDLCSLALLGSDGEVREEAFEHRMELLETLYTRTDAFLALDGLALRDVAAFAVGIGPGSFTGVRIGVMTAKAWSWALARPLAGIGALEAVAADQDGQTIVALIRARPGLVYGAAYADGRELLAPGLFSPEELALAVSGAGIRAAVVRGDGLERGGDAVLAALAACGVRCEAGGTGRPTAGVIARLGAARLGAGHVDDPTTLTPLYVAAPLIGGKPAPAI